LTRAVHGSGACALEPEKHLVLKVQKKTFYKKMSGSRTNVVDVVPFWLGIGEEEDLSFSFVQGPLQLL